MGNFPWSFMMLGRGYGFGLPWVSLLPFILIWSLIWKGLSLWQAAKRDEKAWFIIFLILNTAGILEIIYLVFVVHFFTATKKKLSSRKK